MDSAGTPAQLCLVAPGRSFLTCPSFLSLGLVRLFILLSSLSSERSTRKLTTLTNSIQQFERSSQRVDLSIVCGTKS